METFDLRRHLAALGDEPVTGDDRLPVHVLEARVRRGRSLRVSGIVGAAAAAVVGIAVAVQALPADRVPAPAETPTPTVTEPAPSPDPTPEPTETPTEDPEPDGTATPPPDAVVVPTLLALTVEGDLVELEPGTGAVVRVVTSGLSVYDPGKIGLAVAPDGTRAWVTTWDDAQVNPLLVEVSLADGARRTVGVGVNPAISPDGSTLAYPGPLPGRDFGDSWGLNLLDVASGDVRHLPEPFTGESDLFSVDWSVDGSTLVLPSASGASLRILPAGATSLDEAAVVGTAAEGTTWDEPQVLADGTVLVATSNDPYEPTATGWAVVDLDTGALLESGTTVTEGGPNEVVGLATHPTERRAAVLVGQSEDPDRPSWRLASWEDGVLTDIGGSYVALGW